MISGGLGDVGPLGCYRGGIKGPVQDTVSRYSPAEPAGVSRSALTQILDLEILVPPHHPAFTTRQATRFRFQYSGRFGRPAAVAIMSNIFQLGVYKSRAPACKGGRRGGIESNARTVLD